MPKFEYESFFPFEKIRNEQRKAIEFAIDSFEAGKKYVILELGTGVGKSATGMCVSGYMNAHYGMDTYLKGTYILTTQKVLQQQYVDDFGPGVGRGKNLLKSIKSANNYMCKFYSDQSCAESRRVLVQLRKVLNGSEFMKTCKSDCGYSHDKSEFIESPNSVTNFSYFFAETTYGNQLKPRTFMVIDEAHNTESELGKFTEISISERFAKDILKCKPPASDDQKVVYDWLCKVYKSKLSRHINKLLISMQCDANTMSEPFKASSKQYEQLDKHICKINRFIEIYDSNPSNWIMDTIQPTTNQTKLVSKRRKNVGYKKYEFKSVDVSDAAKKSLLPFAERILFMSATIIDHELFCKSIGLDLKDVAFISIPSPFKVENKPIYYVPVGSMSMSSIDATLPNLAKMINTILESHKDVKGIIHCVNFKIAQYLNENLKSSRVLVHDSDTRELILQKHISSDEATVLLSPSMMEGVDLADDASRFQILCKLPYPYLGDSVVKKRMQLNEKWYQFQTAKSIIQSVGRSIRNENDHAVTYILDSDWSRFYRFNKHLFNSDFVVTNVG